MREENTQSVESEPETDRRATERWEDRDYVRQAFAVRAEGKEGEGRTYLQTKARNSFFFFTAWSVV